ncbi:MAG: succinylglutamate desuccinylase [Marinobacter sp.]|uniref:succinylglutamate desuccinylase n=1 Tax=Marinobacter sp. TaxID=50741 RepID=UPI00349FF604
MSVRDTLFDGEPDWLTHTLTFAGKVAQPASVVLPDGARIERPEVGVLRLIPVQPEIDERLIVSAGVHGNETAPIEVLNGLVNGLLSGEWTLRQEVLLILGNPPAMVEGSRFVEHNLNRLFSGVHQKAPYAGTDEARRAEALEAICREFSKPAPAVAHYDLHTAIRPSKREKFALYPYVPGRKVPNRQLAFLAESGVSTLLLQHKSGTTFASFSSTELGAESFTVELGQVRPFGQNDLTRFTGIEASLKALMIQQPLVTESDGRMAVMAVFEVVEEILNTGPNFRFHIPDDVANFTEYPPGEVIWEDDNDCYRVGDQPEAIVFPNRDVPVGHRVGLMVRRKPLIRE